VRAATGGRLRFALMLSAGILTTALVTRFLSVWLTPLAEYGTARSSDTLKITSMSFLLQQKLFLDRCSESLQDCASTKKAFYLKEPFK